MSSSAPLHTYMELFKELCELVGSKIRFKTTDGEFEGIVKDVLPRSQRVTVEHVYYVPTLDYMGNLHFSLREFLSYSVIESSEKGDYQCQILDKNCVGNKHNITNVLNQDLEEQSVSGKTTSCGGNIFVDDFVMNLPDKLQRKLAQDWLVLENIDKEFYEAIRYISKQKVIGVSFEGSKISRHGKLSWVCVSTQLCVFLFDIELLGKDTFDKGLKDIFQNKNIEKVIHDSRQPSDCLSHLFGTELVNVYDTQIADLLINMQKYGDKMTFKYVSSLDHCIVHYLDVPQEFLYNRKKYLSLSDEVQIRPISNDYRSAVIRNVVYLVLLKETLAELMLTPFRKIVDIYLNVLANASEPELLLDVSVSEMIPPALVMQGIETVRLKDVSGEVSTTPLVCKFKSSESSTVDKYSRPSNIEPENTSSEKLMNGKSDMNADTNFHNKSVTRDIDVSNLTFFSKKKPDTQRVVVEQLSMHNSKRHMDNLYHRLVNNLGNASESVDVKPSQHYVSNFVVKKSTFSKTTAVESTLNLHSESNKSELCNSGETVSECSSDADISTDISAAPSDTWEKLRSAFGVSYCASENRKSEDCKKKIRFVPAGMDF